MKNTIIISAATYLVLNFLIWMLGWVIWPVVYVVTGFVVAKFCEKVDGFSYPGIGRVLAVCAWPLWFLITLTDNGKKVFDGITPPNWFPSIRNPFVWPEKNDN